MSERPLPLLENRHLADYFIAHIENSLQDPAAKAACFVVIDEHRASGVCKGLLEDGLDFVDGSRWLARRLYDSIAKDQRISPGDLAVCFYRVASEPGFPRYLGLLKLDPTEVLRHRTERDSQGNLYVSLEVQTDVLPTARERLQKCAFVRALDPRPEHDMMLLDRQVGPALDRVVADFFIEDFLGAELAVDPRQQTKRLYSTLTTAHNRLRPQLEPEQDHVLTAAIQRAVSAPDVNLDTWLGELPLPETHKMEIEGLLSRRMSLRAFELDTMQAMRLVSRRRFRGDHGLGVEVSSDAYDQVVEAVQYVQEPGEEPYYRVVLRTRQWSELPK